MMMRCISCNYFYDPKTNNYYCSKCVVSPRLRQCHHQHIEGEFCKWVSIYEYCMFHR